MNTRITIIMLVTLCFGLFHTMPTVIQHVHAQDRAESVGLSISPPHAEVMLQPGKSILHAFTVRNQSETEIEVIPTLIPFLDVRDDGSVILDPHAKPFKYARLENLDIELDHPFRLAGGKSQQLVLKISIPEGESDQDYPLTFLMKAQPPQESLLSNTGNPDQTTSQLTLAVGAHILLTVSKSGLRTGNLQIFSVDLPKIIDMFSPLVLNIKAKNGGRNYAKATGKVSIASTLFGDKQQKTFEILEENILADAIRTLHAAQPDGLQSENKTPSDFRYDPLFLLGPYHVEVSLGEAGIEDADSYHDANRAEVQTYTVWALPLSPIGILLGVICSMYIYRYFSRRLLTVE